MTEQSTSFSDSFRDRKEGARFRCEACGGALVYATCSILPEENEMQLRAFLERHPEYTLEPLPEDVAALFPNARRECGLQLLPGPDGDEGFFMARLRRQG